MKVKSPQAILPLGFVFAMIFLCASPARTEELHFLGGVMKEVAAPRDGSYAWQLEYREGLGEFLEGSVSYLNEGHLPGHHRDGNMLQIWGRTSLFERRVSLAAGIGPYVYYDTVRTATVNGYRDNHGWGGVISLAATWYSENRWLLQLRGNWTGTDSFDSLSALVGVGYQLEAPPVRGPLPEPLPQKMKTGNELTLFGGRTIVNSLPSEHSVAAGVEYRRGLWRHVDWTVAWLYEGDNRLKRQNGIQSQLWGVRTFCDERLALGIGGGLYVAVDRNDRFLHAVDIVSPVLTLSGSFRLSPRWHLRTSWNRLITDYDGDSDVILAGIGYRF